MIMKNRMFELIFGRSQNMAAALAVAAFLFGRPLWSQAQPNDEFGPPPEVGRTVERQVHRLVAQATRDAQRERAEAEGNLSEAEHKAAEIRDQVMFRRPGGAVDRLQGVVRRGPGSGRSLVIRTGDLDPKEQANLEEDLAVMAHLLEKAVVEDSNRPWQQRKAMGIDVFFAPNTTPFRSMFIQNHGALFLVNVGFPLLPPASKEAPASEKPTSDSDWEQARRELYGGGRSERKWIAGPSEPYEEERVNKLKDQLLETLKNAANIRGMKGDDLVTVCVFGGSVGAPMKVRTTTKGPAPKPGRPGPFEEREETIVMADDAPPGGGRSTMLTLQVKKSDADNFAKGKLDLGEFRKKVRVTTYAGGGMEGSSWFGFGGGFSGSIDSR